MPPFGLTQTGPEMHSWYLATESHTQRVARICSGVHRACTRSSVTRRLRWSWVPASHHRRAMTRRLSTAERARSLDCEEESAAGQDDGRSLNALARATCAHVGKSGALCGRPIESPDPSHHTPHFRERESEEQQQPSASRGVSGEDPETAALRKLKEHSLSQRRPRC